ncbi:MAG: 16S rRNA (guanine(966)-N(2))-methyltransferase RsmD [Methylococcales bacterium]|jgi:16S rRNA (guanine966-N2)-methyltransferase|nr:16S rRNA (guanine(966)-N(2))-methyltransferase RsmD [Methylococcales bacterium]MBT7443026.1 16S rRNA (guanine(966)-N(2))-methyltransferase RsmD [Methylococcales bacterium]
MAKPRGKQQVRIIAGEWRGRKLDFPDVDGLRPSSDRVRETVFNWLQRDLLGARCVDLFAGSGALGFEAASRGAKQVLILEKHAAAWQSLKQAKSILQAQNVEVQKQDTMVWLRQPGDAFDVVFVDPPFQLQAVDDICEMLEQQGRVVEGSLIYLEYPLQQTVTLPPTWTMVKQKQAGNVVFGLAKKGG